MTLTLLLTRHAKSSWEDPTLEDIDRPLNRRGRLAADAVGHWLATTGHLPGAVLLSPSRRTRETLQHLRPHLPGALVVREEAQIYEAEAEQLLEVLREAPRQTPLMLLGHNPGIGDLAERLLARPPQHPEFQRYPTGATLVARFPAADWADLEPGTGEVLAFVVPRELAAREDLAD